MTKQDTWNRLRHNVCAGMVLEHKFRQMMVGAEFDWTCRIIEVDEANNNLAVSITSKFGHSHFEDWDMAITVGGLIDGEYIEIIGETE